MLVGPALLAIGILLARKTEVIEKYVDDLDGTSASETITFGIDGKQFQIDLNRRNAKALRSDLAKWSEHARRPRARTNRRTRGSGSGRNSESATIRAWAIEQGIPVPSRGRIPATLVEQYRNA